MAALRENDLANRRPPLPSLLTTLGGTIAAVCSRCRSRRNLRIRHGQEIGADYTDMIYAATPEEIEARRKAFIRKWRLKHRAVADSLEEAGDRLFTFTRLPPSQWRSARTTDEIDKSFLLRDLLFWRGTGDRVAKSRARGCQPGRAAVTVAPHWRHPCAAYQDHAAAIG